MKIIQVAGPVIIENGKVLLIIDEDNEYKFPGGRVEQGETHEQTIKREAKEEISADIKVLDFIKSSSRVVGDKRYDVFSYRGKLLTRPKASSEVRSIVWVDYNHSKKLKLTPHVRKVLKFLHKKGEL